MTASTRKAEKRPTSTLLAGAFIGTLLLAFWLSPPLPETALAESPTADISSSLASFRTTFLPTESEVVHSPTLAELPDGRLAAAWMGSKSGQPEDDVIRLSVQARGEWQPPLLTASRESAAASTLAHLRWLGQPQLHAEGTWLHIWFAAGALGEDIGARLHHQVSTDGGQRWSPVETLPALAWPVPAPPGDRPLALADGGLLLPLPAGLLRLSATGKMLDHWPLPPGNQGQIAAFTAGANQQALVYLRANDGDRLLALEGPSRHWHTVATRLPALKNTPMALLRLSSGRILLAGNPSEQHAALALWYSDDAGMHWQMARMLETGEDGAADFSAPRLLQGRNGQIHLLYALRKQHLRLLSFSPLWLDNR